LITAGFLTNFVCLKTGLIREDRSLNNEKIEEIKLDFEDASIMANKKAE
jgi:hypothetical protein